MTKGTGVESSAVSFVNSNAKASIAASKDMWLKRLEEEFLKKNRLDIDSKIINSDSKYATQLIDMNHHASEYNEQLNESVALDEFNERIADIAVICQESKQRVEIGTLLDSRPYMNQSDSDATVQSPKQGRMQLDVKTQNTKYEHIMEMLLKEQKYFELMKPFGFKITEQGVQVWLYEPAADSMMSQVLLRRLRKQLKVVGIMLHSLTVNGKLIWKQQGQGNSVRQKNQYDGVDKIY